MSKDTGGPAWDHVTKEGVKVKPGQIWQDLDKRMNGGRCRVVSVSCGRARMTNIMGCSSVSTLVAINRMHKNSTGWALVSEAPQ